MRIEVFLKGNNYVELNPGNLTNLTLVEIFNKIVEKRRNYKNFVRSGLSRCVSEFRDIHH